MIGVGAVVTKDIPLLTFWVDNSAKQTGFVKKEGKTLPLDCIDKNGVQYRIINGEPLL